MISAPHVLQIVRLPDDSGSGSCVDGGVLIEGEDDTDGIGDATGRADGINGGVGVAIAGRVGTFAGGSTGFGCGVNGGVGGTTVGWG